MYDSIAYCPDVVRTMMAVALLWKDASTAAMAIELTLSPSLWVEV